MKALQFWKKFRQSRRVLEALVAERTAELAKANDALRTETSERKRAEDLWRESERRFHTLTEAVPQQIWTSQPDGTIDYFNQRMLDYFGRTTEQMFGWGWKDVIHPDDLEKCVTIWSHSLATGEPYEMEFRLKTKEGSYRWHLARALPQRAVTGRIERWFGSNTDISERMETEESLRVKVADLKKTEERLQIQQAELRALFDFLPALIVVKDTNNRILRVNKRVADSLGKTIEEIEGKECREIYPIDADKYYADDLEVVYSGKPKLGIVEVFRDKDGRDIWIKTNKVPYCNQDGKVTGVVVLAEDITEQRRSGEALRLLSSAVEQSKESILITDSRLDLPGPGIVFVNPAFTHMTGYTSEDVLGKTPRMLQGPRTDAAVLRRLRENLARGDAFEGEAVNYRKDGTEFYMEWQVAPIRDGGSAITHFVAIQRDISRRKELESRLFQSQKLETVGKLAGGIAHEFNSIMTAIIGQSELLLADLPRENPLRHNAAEIRKAADRAATLTRQLLAYGRKQILQPEILNLNSVLSGMETVLGHLTGRTVNLRILPAASLQTVKVDAGQIEQVIMNVVMNAIDAMPNGGKLTLETANVTLDQKYVSHFPELKAGEYVMLAITDTGAGMNQEVQARMFDPFFSTKGEGRGTGLGLATSYGILKQSGGHINAYSEPGRGATFKIYLPQAGAQAAQSGEPVEALPMPGGRETILLVEDDPALREMAAALLQRLGYTVWTAANGIEALNVAHLKGRGHIDLLFTDVVMPHMSGKELSDRIRSLSPETAILFTSAYTESAIVHQGVLNEGVALLQKPFTPLALARKVRQMLDREISKEIQPRHDNSSGN